MPQNIKRCVICNKKNSYKMKRIGKGDCWFCEDCLHCMRPGTERLPEISDIKLISKASKEAKNVLQQAKGAMEYLFSNKFEGVLIQDRDPEEEKLLPTPLFLDVTLKDKGARLFQIGEEEFRLQASDDRYYIFNV